MALSLRVFPFEGDLISTFEQDPACDPAVIKTVDPKNLRYDILFPEIIPHPQRRNPVPSESRPPPGDPVRGFPIRWLQPELEWLAYLPSVVTYHYPIFMNMNRSPDIVAADRGFVLEPSVVAHWSNVENIIQTTIKKLREDAVMAKHKYPYYPSSFNYRKSFSKRKFARDAMKQSILAFHHMLAYCSYVIASVEGLHISLGQHRSLYEDPSRVGPIFEKIASKDSKDSSHILLKLLWSTLVEMHKTRNFVGTVITYDRPCDCQSVHDMHHYGVPVFIRWSSESGLQKYSLFPRNQLLMPWYPRVELFEALDQPQDPLDSHSGASPTQQVLPPPSAATLDMNADRHPWEYVERRKAAIASVSNKPQFWSNRENSAKSFQGPGKRGALVFQFALADAVEQDTGRGIKKWKRTKLTRAAAQLLWEDVDPRKLWYDCEHDQWNHCSEFDFAENARYRSESDDEEYDDYMRGPLPPQPEQNDAGPAHIDVAGGSVPESESTVAPPTEALPFNNHAHLRRLLLTQYNTPSELASIWGDAEDFFYKRYGLEHVSEEKDTDKIPVWSTRLGMSSTVPSVDVVQLHDSFVKGEWPPSICDLSPGLVRTESFPTKSPGTAIHVRSISNPKGYIVTFGSMWDVDWKLLIQDPLTILQIEREGWDCDPHALVVNLIKKGIPFQILNPRSLEGAQFYDHPGPVVHPVAREPRYADYLAYRQELVRFFAHYPHAYATALSSGGILWRIAMDVLPPPDETDITRPFHPDGCVSVIIDGIKHWTPKLTWQEEDVVVGVYKWPVSTSDSPRDDSWWPKRRIWDDSGLCFGAWAPLDERWYADRSSRLNTEAASCIRAKKWKALVKYQGRDSRNFLAGARSLASTFVRDHRS